jgi:hypothetical protein
MANPFPFTAGQVLTAAQMNGIGERVAFTPTWTNLTVGNGTQSFSYVRVQNLVYIQGKFTFGTTSAVTGGIFMNAPVTSTNQPDVSVIGDAYMADFGVGNAIGVVLYSSNLIFVNNLLTNGTYALNSNFTATAPFVWSVNDYLTVNAVYTV